MKKLDRAANKQLRFQLDRRWSELCSAHAPLRDDIWSHSDGPPLSINQGWKLHLSATPLCAVDLFERSIAAIMDAECPFKVASSFQNILSLNEGVFGRSQVGKIFTVYCPDPDKARCLAEKLHVLTRGIKAPIVPSDRRFRPGSAVFYRYGSYAHPMEQAGKKTSAYQGPDGRLVPDRRTRATAVPAWLRNPFAENKDESRIEPPARQCRYVVVKPFTWRGRGGVYLVRDRVSAVTYVVKEGLRHGEGDFYGRDGFDRLKAERRKLRILSTLVPTPQIVDSFEQDGNAYLVLNYVDGKNLAQLMNEDAIPSDEKIGIAKQMIDVVASLHAAGWAWRDCKLSNFVYAEQKVWALDFESAMRIKGRKQGFVSTKGYFLESPYEVSGIGARRQDLFALGIALHALFIGITERALSEGASLSPIPEVIPAAMREQIYKLQSAMPRARPSAAAARELFSGWVPLSRASGVQPGESRPLHS